MKHALFYLICYAVQVFGQDTMLGILAEPTKPEIQQHYEKKLGSVSGLTILQLVANSPASKVLQIGDILIKAGDTPLYSTRDLKDIVALQQPGDFLDLTILRHGEIQNHQVMLGNRIPQRMIKDRELNEVNRLLWLLTPQGDKATLNIPALRRQMLRLSDMGLATKDEQSTCSLYLISSGKLIRITSSERGVNIEDSHPDSPNCFLEASYYKRVNAQLPETLSNRILSATYYHP